MKSSYKRLGDFIHKIDVRNKNSRNTKLLGLSMTKEFRSHASNIIGTDLSRYKVVDHWQFACDFMSIIRVRKLPVVLQENDEQIIVSPAYTTFEVIDSNELHPEYLMMWFRRSEFDRYAYFCCDSAVRGGFNWDELCDVQLPVPSIEKQREIVKEYNTIVNRIKLNEQLNQKLEETAQALYKHWFVDFEFPNKNGQPYKSSGGKMVYNEELDQEIPEAWKLTSLLDISDLITKGTTPKKMYSQFDTGRIPYVRGQSIGSNHFIDPAKTNFIDCEIHESELKRSIILEKDILFTITGTLGEFAIADKQITPANTNQNVAIIRLKAIDIHSNYLLFLFMGGWHKEFLNVNRQEAVQANLNLTMIGNMKIILPSYQFLEFCMKKVNSIIEFKHNQHQQKNSLLKLEQLVLQRISKAETSKVEQTL